MNQKVFKIINIITFSVLCILMVIAGFVDYELMDAMSDFTRLGGIFNRYGQMPAVLISLAFFNALFIYFLKKSKHLFAILCVFVNVLLIMLMHSLFFGRNIFIEYTLLSIFMIGTIVLFYYVKTETFTKLLQLLLLATVLVVVTVVICQIIKLLWGRVRYRDLEYSQQFTHWFIPQGFNGHLSFISGHTIAAGTSMFVMFIPSIFKDFNKVLYRFLVVITAFIMIATAYSRIVVGAHYLSDVVGSIIVTYITILLIRKHLVKDVKTLFN